MTIEGCKIEMAARPLELTDDLAPIDLSRSLDMHMELQVDDVDAYRGLAAEHGFYTLSMSFDLDPRHRKASTLRQRLRRGRDIVRWDWRRLTGRPLARELTVTIPDVRAEDIKLERRLEEIGA